MFDVFSLTVPGWRLTWTVKLEDAVHSPPTWYVKTPEGTLDEWFYTRAEAEAYALGVMEDALRDSGEGSDDVCYVMNAVGHTTEVIDAHRDDNSDLGEWLRERNLDYHIAGYKMVDCTPLEVFTAVLESVLRAGGVA